MIVFLYIWLDFLFYCDLLFLFCHERRHHWIGAGNLGGGSPRDSTNKMRLYLAVKTSRLHSLSGLNRRLIETWLGIQSSKVSLSGDWPMARSHGCVFQSKRKAIPHCQ